MSSNQLTRAVSESLQARCDLLFEQCSTEDEFLQQVLQAAVELKAVDAAAIMQVLSPQEARLQTGISLNQLMVNGPYRLDGGHFGEILNCVRQQKICIVTDRVVPGFGLKQHSVVMVPLTPGAPPIRVLELFTLLPPTEMELSRLKDVTQTLLDYVKRFQSRGTSQEQPPDPALFWKQFDVFLIRLQQSLDLQRTAAVAVNDGRLLIGCDRLSIAMKRGRRARIIAISGQDGVQQRANLVKSMSRVAEVVLGLGTPVNYHGNIEDIPPQLEAPMAEYLAESRTRMVSLLPLREPPPLLTEEDINANRRNEVQRKLLGILIIEQVTDSRPKPGVPERSELIAAHVETAIANCDRYESIFLLPLWRMLGRGVAWFKGRRLWGAVAIASALVLLGLLLWLIPWNYRVEGRGLAMPILQHEIFAPWNGDVREILVESGQRVQQGDLLLVLESDELDAEKISLENELLEKQKLALALTHQQHAARRKNDQNELARLEADFVKTKVEVEGVQAKLSQIRSRIDRLHIRSPANGVVATFQLQQLLQNRPVQRGELLLEVMEPEGEWRLELEVPEHRMGHLLEERARSADGRLLVEYVLATSVERSYQGWLTEIGTRSNQSQAEGTSVEAFVEIAKEDLPHRSIGAEVIAKIHCGKKSLFYVLFGDVVEFIQRYFWL